MSETFVIGHTQPRPGYARGLDAAILETILVCGWLGGEDGVRTGTRARNRLVCGRARLKHPRN